MEEDLVDDGGGPSPGWGHSPESPQPQQPPPPPPPQPQQRMTPPGSRGQSRAGSRPGSRNAAAAPAAPPPPPVAVPDDRTRRSMSPTGDDSYSGGGYQSSEEPSRRPSESYPSSDAWPDDQCQYIDPEEEPDQATGRGYGGSDAGYLDASAYPEGGSAEGDEGPPPEMAPCSICSRNFAKDRLARHEAICQKQATKKRKVFGESAERLKLQEKAAAEEAKRAEEKAKKKAIWKAQHEAFQNALKTAAAVAKGEAPPPDLHEVEDDRTPCPHCGRKFAKDTADRHIPKCAQTKAKPNAVGATQKRPSTNKLLPPAETASVPPQRPHREPIKNNPDKQTRASAAATPSPTKARKPTPPPKRPVGTPARVR